MKNKIIGNALLSALFIMTLIAISATAIVKRLSIDIASTDRFINSNRRYLAAQFIPFWAISQLQKTSTLLAENNEGKVLTFPMQWTNLYSHCQLSGEVYDLQARFNLNNLVQPRSDKQLIKLMTLVQQKPENENLYKMIANALKEWILPETGYHQDNWSQYYSSLSPPYQTAHQLMQSSSELPLVAGMTAPLYQALLPYITTLPESVPININTASMVVLQAVNPEMTDEQAAEFIQLRAQAPILTPMEFNEVLKKFHLSAGSNTFQSHYFLSVARVKQSHQKLTLFSILKRTKLSSDSWQVQIIKEAQTTL